MRKPSEKIKRQDQIKMIFDHKYLEKVVSYLIDEEWKRNEL
jgi:hypothetical protein